MKKLISMLALAILVGCSGPANRRPHHGDGARHKDMGKQKEKNMNNNRQRRGARRGEDQ